MIASDKQNRYDKAYLRLALSWAQLSHCARKKVGAIIVKDSIIISDGYNGTPAGFDNCCENDEGQTHWYVLHAEANAILKVARSSNNCKDATLYLTHSPCKDCSKLVLQSGITRLVYQEAYKDTSGIDFLKSAGLASGGLWGSGLGASKQKWANLAEAHTDFIFSVIGEELGLLGTLLVLTLYAALIYSILRVALKTKDDFSRYVTAGIACWLIAQVTINIGSVTSLIPVIGVTLPLISYGGSSLLANLLAIGYVLGVARRTPEISEGIKANRVRKLSQ